jgi:hypothetical protein
VIATEDSKQVLGRDEASNRTVSADERTSTADMAAKLRRILITARLFEPSRPGQLPGEEVSVLCLACEDTEDAAGSYSPSVRHPAVRPGQRERTRERTRMRN